MDLKNSPYMEGLPTAQHHQAEYPPAGILNGRYRVLKWTICLLLAGFALWTIYDPKSLLEFVVGQDDHRSGSGLSQKPISGMSIVTDSTEKWEKDNEFCNIVGSGGDIPKKEDGSAEYDNWLDAWKTVAGWKGEGNPPCAVSLTAGDHHDPTSFIGGHVVQTETAVSPEYGTSGVVRLVPLCSRHNQYNGAAPLTAVADVTAVKLNNYCQWTDSNGKSSSCTNKRSDSTCGEDALAMTRTMQNTVLITSVP